ncbi:hypothetical protein PXD56_14790 [Maribacter sp. SA7]|uniref:hypothetical protein n=1 Tax=Maribacter zhoushanensis TaxID=3030012 RepID=UPI0023EACBB4|nr:hypothetical protein [Maribacter zhoushanensis]MDF4204239.1 hypothetical protein [Maribacter zhoushanensis]
MKLIILHFLAIVNINSDPFIKTLAITDNQSKTIKQEAYLVLNTKCNFCHSVKKNRTVFSLENMDGFSKAIANQVFIKKKMPKGRKNKLSTLEEEQLLNWIKTLDQS